MHFVYFLSRKYFVSNNIFPYFYYIRRSNLEQREKREASGDDITSFYRLKLESNDKLELESKF